MQKTIEKEQDGWNVHSYLSKILSVSRRTLIALKKKPEGITVNGNHVTVRAILHEGDILALDLDDEVNEKLVPTYYPLDILYEDEHLIAVNKPAGMATHPSQGHFTDSLASALAYYFLPSGKPFVFRAVNRLDLDTSGIVLVSKDKLTSSLLSASMEAHAFEKHYLALVHGLIEEDEGTVIGNIKRKLPSIIERTVCSENEGEYAETHYRVLERLPGFTLVDAFPVTGRTHQIRVHFASVGHPLANDFLYGKEEPELIPRQALHCSSLSFPLPYEKEKRMTLSAPLPKDMEETIAKIKQLAPIK